MNKLLYVLAFCLSLCACGNKSQRDKNESLALGQAEVAMPIGVEEPLNEPDEESQLCYEEMPDISFDFWVQDISNPKVRVVDIESAEFDTTMRYKPEFD